MWQARGPIRGEHGCASQWQAGTVCCRLVGLPLSVSDEGQPRALVLTRAPPRWWGQETEHERGEDDRGDKHRESGSKASLPPAVRRWDGVEVRPHRD